MNTNTTTNTTIELLEEAIRSIAKEMEKTEFEVELTNLFAARNAVFSAISFLERAGVK